MKEYLERVRSTGPMIHNITNYVTANDVANLLLACGASPIMSDESDEVEEITARCDGLNLNMGTIHKDRIPVMCKAGKMANQKGHPVLLDPVGICASRFRQEAASRLIQEVHFSAIRGNASELKMLMEGKGHASGVDAALSDGITRENLMESIAVLKNYATTSKCIVAATGAIDLVADADRCYVIRNGCSQMSKVTGTGCQLSALITAFLAASPKEPLEAVAAAVCTMGVAGELAWSRMKETDGNATYRNRIIDAVSQMTGEELERGADYEVQ